MALEFSHFPHYSSNLCTLVFFKLLSNVNDKSDVNGANLTQNTGDVARKVAKKVASRQRCRQREVAGGDIEESLAKSPKKETSEAVGDVAMVVVNHRQWSTLANSNKMKGDNSHRYSQLLNNFLVVAGH